MAVHHEAQRSTSTRSWDWSTSRFQLNSLRSMPLSPPVHLHFRLAIARKTDSMRMPTIHRRDCPMRAASAVPTVILLLIASLPLAAGDEAELRFIETWGCRGTKP